MTVPMTEVQGIILRGYEDLKAARFVLLKIADPVAARAWLADLVQDQILTTAEIRPTSQAVNVAFTPAGLTRLGLPAECVDGFAREFLEGMDTDHRRRVLGDTEARSPNGWDWGNREDADNIHVLLMVYADTPTDRKSVV